MASAYNYKKTNVPLAFVPLTPALDPKITVVRIDLTGLQDALLVKNKRILEFDLETEDDEGSNTSSNSSSNSSSNNEVQRVPVFHMENALIMAVEDSGLVDEESTQIIALHQSIPFLTVEEIAAGDIQRISWDKTLEDDSIIRFSINITGRNISITSAVQRPIGGERQLELTKRFATTLLRLGAARKTQPLKASGAPLATLNRTLRGNRNRSSIAGTVMNNPNLARIVRSHLSNTGRNYNHNQRTGRNRNLGHLKERFMEVQRVLDGFDERMRSQPVYYDTIRHEVIMVRK